MAELASVCDGTIFPTVDQRGGRGSRAADAAQFILLGADTVQVCTGVMKFGYAMVRQMKEPGQLHGAHGFESVAQFRGHSLQYLTTHADLVRRQANAREAGRRQEHLRRGLARRRGGGAEPKL